MVQGLLTATLPTKLGSDSEVLASAMDINFHRPVYTGELIICQSTFDTVVERDDRYDFTTDVVCENADGQIVLTSATEGLFGRTCNSSSDTYTLSLHLLLPRHVLLRRSVP